MWNTNKAIVICVFSVLVGCGGNGIEVSRNGEIIDNGQTISPTTAQSSMNDVGNTPTSFDSSGQSGSLTQPIAGIPPVGSQSLSTTRVPALTEDSFLLGSEILGQMNIYNPFSGAVERFSDLSQVDSIVDYQATVDVVDGMIITVADDNTINGLDITTGDFLWDIGLGDIVRPFALIDPTPPVCDGDICYAMGAFGDLLAIDAIQRTVVWRTPLFPNTEDHLSVFRLLVTKERIFSGAFRSSTVFGDVEPKLYAVSRETGEIEKELPAGRASLAGDLLLISGTGLHAYDFDTLEPVWFADLEFVSDVAVINDILVVSDAEKNVPVTRAQRVKGLNRLDGSILWSQEAGTTQAMFTPTTDGRLVYAVFAEQCTNVPCSTGYPMALNPADGSIVWTNEDVTVAQTIAPVVVDGHLLYNEVRSFRDTGGGFNLDRGVASLDSSNGSIDWISFGRDSFYSLTAIIDGVAVRSLDNPGVVLTR